jgi:hypothetical protein
VDAIAATGSTGGGLPLLVVILALVVLAAAGLIGRTLVVRRHRAP